MGLGKEMKNFNLEWREEHPEGYVFFDIHGHKYLFNKSNNKVEKLSSVPDMGVLSEINLPLINKISRPVCVISGKGTFENFIQEGDPREIERMEYSGDMIYNLEADASTQYLIFNQSKYYSRGAAKGEFRIRGSFKRIAIVESDIINTKIQIITDQNPEIFIIGSNIELSDIEVINNNGEPYSKDRMMISETMPDAQSVRDLLEYVRSDEPDVSTDDANDSSVGVGVAAALAVAGMFAASAVNKKKVKTIVQKVTV